VHNPSPAPRPPAAPLLPLAVKLLRGEDLRVGRTGEFSATCAFLAAQDVHAPACGLWLAASTGTRRAGPRSRALERLAPRDLDLWIVPENPDGVAADRRQNAHGVELNRNFPWHWRPSGGVDESGPHPLSEREARIAHALTLHARSAAPADHQHQCINRRARVACWNREGLRGGVRGLLERAIRPTLGARSPQLADGH
jgi:protein MpaA